MGGAGNTLAGPPGGWGRTPLAQLPGCVTPLFARPRGTRPVLQEEAAHSFRVTGTRACCWDTSLLAPSCTLHECPEGWLGKGQRPTFPAPFPMTVGPPGPRGTAGFSGEARWPQAEPVPGSPVPRGLGKLGGWGLFTVRTGNDSCANVTLRPNPAPGCHLGAAPPSSQQGDHLRVQATEPPPGTPKHEAGPSRRTPRHLNLRGGSPTLPAPETAAGQAFTSLHDWTTHPAQGPRGARGRPSQHQGRSREDTVDRQCPAQPHPATLPPAGSGKEPPRRRAAGWRPHRATRPERCQGTERESPELLPTPWPEALSRPACTPEGPSPPPGMAGRRPRSTAGPLGHASCSVA